MMHFGTRSFRIGEAVALCAALASSAACNAVSGVDDYEFGSPTGAGGATSSGSGQGGATTGSSGQGGGTSSGTGGAACDDGSKNGAETDTDCGGPACEPCALGKTCNVAGDCVSGDCVDGVCCGACAEDCNNGVDDNDDSLVDCADPLCSAFECVPAVPATWTGPVRFFQGQGPVPSCNAPWTDSLEGGAGSLGAPPASCSACSCGAASGGTCGLPTVSFYDPSDCGGAPMATVTVTGTACQSINVPNTADSAEGSTIPVMGGSCTPAGGQATIAPASFAQQALACSGAAVGAGCMGGGVCAPKAGASFDPGACISKDGDVACPSPYTVKHLMYGGIADGRSCTGCGCGAPAGMTCAGSTKVYETPGCSNVLATLQHDAPSCGSLAQDAIAIQFTPSGNGPVGGTCTANGGQPTGTATPSSPTTVCCTP